jgi:hypothetical protein
MRMMKKYSETVKNYKMQQIYIVLLPGIIYSYTLLHPTSKWQLITITQLQTEISLYFWKYEYEIR